MKTLAVEHAKGLIHRFLDVFRSDLQRHGDQLYEFIERGASSMSFEVAWDRVFPSLFRLTHQVDVALARKAAVTLGLRLAWGGVEGKWSFEAGSLVELRWGEWSLPATNRIRVDATSIQTTLILDGDQSTFTFRRTLAGWSGEGAEPVTILNIEGTPVVIHTPTSLDSIGYPSVSLTQSPVVEIVRAGTAAVVLIKRYAPKYLPWVTRVLRHLVPINGDEALIKSGSDYYRPGIVEMSFPVAPVQFAEVLVHECSHQYLNWLSRLGPLVDGTDANLYFSPVKKEPRSLVNILIAYHAFANVLLFYRQCQSSNLCDGDYCRINEAKLIPQLKKLEIPLRSSSGLTPLGEALWRPVAEHIRMSQAKVAVL